MKPAQYNILPEVDANFGASIATGARSLFSSLRRCCAASVVTTNAIWRHQGWNINTIVGVFTVFPIIIAQNLRSQRNIVKLMNRPAFKGITKTQPQFAFKYITQPYLAKGLTPSERASAFSHNYHFLEQNFSGAFVRKIVEGWTSIYETTVGDNSYTVAMGLASIALKEGELSLELYLNGYKIFVLSFTFINSSIIDKNKSGNAILISRLQGERGAFNLVRTATKDMLDISPPYILFATLNGIASALDVNHIFGTSGKIQICRTEDKAQLFQSAYDDFFLSLGGVDTGDGFFCFEVPVLNKQIEFVKPDHRLRTKKKRKFKAAISDHARNVVLQNRSSSRPLPSREAMIGCELFARRG
jgi:uncharacterized protein VirK/YbjX